MKPGNKIGAVVLAAVFLMTQTPAFAVTYYGNRTGAASSYNYGYQRTYPAVNQTVTPAANQTGAASSGKANHGVSLAYRSINSVTNQYYDRGGKLKTRDKNSIVIDFTSGLDGEESNLPKVRSWFDDQTNAYPLSFMLNTGNYTGGQPYAAVNASQAPLLRIMGDTKYDAAGIGASEFKMGADDLSKMLKTAVKSKEVVPYLTSANVTGKKLKSAYSAYGVKKYVILNKYGTKIAVFGILGDNGSDENSADGITMTDPAEAAASTAKKIRKVHPDVSLVVCMTSYSKDDLTGDCDQKIAKASKKIDLIVSGAQPKESGKDYEKTGSGRAVIAYAGGNGNTGHVVFQKKSNGKYSFHGANTKTSWGKTTKTTSVKKSLTKFRKLADSGYFKLYGYGYDEKLTENGYGLKSEIGSGAGTALGDLISDAYVKAAKEQAGISGDVIGAVWSGAIQSGIESGTVRTKDAYAVLGQGSSADGSSGLPMVSFWLKGSDLEKLAEHAGSMIESKGKSAERLCFSGMTYSYNPHRDQGDRAYSLKIGSGDSAAKVQAEKNYRIVCDRDTADYVKQMASDSKRGPAFTLRNESGDETTGFAALKKGSRTMKAWGALAYQLKNFGAQVPDRYSKAQDRAVYDSSLRPSHLLKDGGKGAWMKVAVVVIIVCLVILLILFLIHLFGGGGRGGRGGYGYGGKRRRKYPKAPKQRPIFSNKR